MNFTIKLLFKTKFYHDDRVKNVSYDRKQTIDGRVCIVLYKPQFDKFRILLPIKAQNEKKAALKLQ